MPAHHVPSNAPHRSPGWLALLALPLLAFVGCAPAERIPDPLNWPREWDGRMLWSTPRAYIYASSSAAAGEVDRLIARAQQPYAAELSQPTPPVLVIVYDNGESFPGGDLRGLLRATFRVTLPREAPPQVDLRNPAVSAPSLEDQIEEAFNALVAAAATAGTSLDVLAGTISLTCDAQALRESCRAPAGPADETHGALIVPTRACLRSSTRRMMKGTLKMYGIGPAAQVLFAPVLAAAESKTVDQLDRLRDVALFDHWLFEYADLPVEEKRALAAARRERLAETAETAAASIVGLAR